MESKLEINRDDTKVCVNSDGNLHRKDGTEVEYVNGIKFWWKNRVLHREDGPSVEYADGTKFWYLNGIEYTHREYKQKMRLIKIKSLIG